METTKTSADYEAELIEEMKAEKPIQRYGVFVGAVLGAHYNNDPEVLRGYLDAGIKVFIKKEL